MKNARIAGCAAIVALYAGSLLARVEVSFGLDGVAGRFLCPRNSKGMWLPIRIMMIFHM
jgi:hypothetical protein